MTQPIPLLLGKSPTGQLVSLPPMAESAHNSWQNEAIGASPYQVLMGYNPMAEWRPMTSTVPAPINWLEQWKWARELAEVQMKKVQNHWVQAKHQGQTFKEGDLVWLEGRNLHLDQPSIKLAAKHHGPFPVVQVLSPLTYCLALPIQWKIHPVFHVDLLTPYKGMVFHGTNYTRPPPDLIDGEEEFEVECILNSRWFGHHKKVQYLVKWLGYPDSDNQWVDWDQFTADEALAEFKEQNPQAVSHIRLAFCIPSATPSWCPPPQPPLLSKMLSTPPPLHPGAHHCCPPLSLRLGDHS